jgi:hypothetical protein
MARNPRDSAPRVNDGCGWFHRARRKRRVVRASVGLPRRRRGHRSAWICTRNDVLGNLAVLFGWPDFIVAAIMASLALQGERIVLRESLAELRIARRLTSILDEEPVHKF